MPTIKLPGRRTCTIGDSLLNLPAVRVLQYQCALSPEVNVDEAFEEQFQRRFNRPALGDTVGQLARSANLAVYQASPQARAFAVLVTAVKQRRVTDFSAPALRDRLGWLLTCGLTEERVQQEQARAEAELRTLTAPYLVAEPNTEAQVAEAFAHLKRRTLALCDLMLGAPTAPLASQMEVGQAVLDLLEPAINHHHTSSIHPRIRQRASEALCLLLLQEQLAGRLSFSPTPGQKELNPHLLPLGTFLEQVRAATHRLPT